MTTTLYLLCTLLLFIASGVAFTFPASSRVVSRTLNPNAISLNLKKGSDSNQFSSTKLLISRDEEEEFFQPEMDTKSFEEKLPIAIGVFVGKNSFFPWHDVKSLACIELYLCTWQLHSHLHAFVFWLSLFLLLVGFSLPFVIGLAYLYANKWISRLRAPRLPCTSIDRSYSLRNVMSPC